MPNLIQPILATTIVSLFSLTGIFALSLREKTLHSILFGLVAFSAGTILGAVFFDLLPEAIELVDKNIIFPYLSFGFVLFFFLERFIYWYHGHGHESDISVEVDSSLSKKRLAYLNLFGDFVHNFIDGMVIAASYLAGLSIGISTTIAVIFHELPQEMGDYGILIFAGFKRYKALIFNFFVALSVVFGSIFGVFFIEKVQPLSGFLISLSTGGFMYLSASELIPELHKEKKFRNSVMQFILFILGMVLIWSLGIIFPE